MDKHTPIGGLGAQRAHAAGANVDHLHPGHSYSSINTSLPWSSSDKEDRHFNIMIIIFLCLLVAGSFWVKSVQLPKVDRKQLEIVPPTIAKVIMEKKKEIEKKVEKPKPVETKVVESAKPSTSTVPVPEQAPVAEVEKPVKTTAPKESSSTAKAKPTAEQVTAAREVAKQSGVFAMKDQLAGLRALSAKPIGLAGGGVGGTSIRTSTNAGATGTGVSRSQIVGKGTGGSGGIAMAAGASSGLGGGAGGGSGGGIGSGSGGRGATNVDSVTLGGKVVDVGGDVAKAVESSKSSGNRSEESIRSVLDSNKASLYAIYNRALREDPSLQGKVTFKLVIQPDGSVSSCSIVSSEITDDSLKNKLISRMKLINFGADNVGVTTTQWAIDFIPN